MSQYGKPRGFFGKVLARGMAWGHKDFYKNAARILDLQKEDDLLEIGFGSGMFIKKYASHASRIRGVDYSEDMVRMASDINRSLVEEGRAEFIRGNVSSLPWGDNEFSAAVAIETFFFWEEPERSLKEIYRVLAPGGRFVLEMAYNNDDGLDHTKHIEKMNLRLYGASEVSNLLERAGFSDVNIEYYKGFWLPFKGHVVPRGMIASAFKKVEQLDIKK